ASAMPTVPNNRADSGTMPGEASTMPTTAVNTINRLTLGLVSSRKSRHRPKPTRAMGGLSGRVGTLQGYHADCRRRPQGAQHRDHADDQEGGTCVVQGGQGQGDAPVHGGDSDANLQSDGENQQTARERQPPALGAHGNQNPQRDQDRA